MLDTISVSAEAESKMKHLDKISINFILSTGRTGSTLLSSMLNMHPEILSVSEEPFAYNLYPKYKNITQWTDETIEEFCYDFYLFSEGKLEPQFGKKEDLFKLLKEHQSVLTGQNAIKLAYFAFFPNKEKEEVNTIVDKQLKFHYFIEDIALYYPNSKFIVLYRDPRDNVLVKMRRALKQQKKASLVYFAKTWNYEYSALINKIRKLPADRFIEIQYEALMKDPTEELKKICHFFNVPFLTTMLNYDEKIKKDLETNKHFIGETVKQHVSLLHQGLTQKVNTDKVGFWKTNFSAKEYNTIWSICGDTAQRIGYQKEECQPIPYFNMSMVGTLLRFNLIKIIIPNLYYKLPFVLRYFIKKLKYGKNFKNGKWATKDFYKSTLPTKP